MIRLPPRQNVLLMTDIVGICVVRHMQDVAGEVEPGVRRRGVGCEAKRVS